MKTLTVLLLLSIMVNGQNKAQITSYEFDVKANEHCLIILYNQDSTKSFTLFDNILEKSQKIIFIIQKEFYKERLKYPDKIVLPFPLLDSGMYNLIFQENDKVNKKKIIFLK